MQNPNDKQDPTAKQAPTHVERSRDNHGSEVAADAARGDDKPKYGGEPWEVAAERGNDRFGKARNDDADRSTLTKGVGNDDDESGSAGDPALQPTEPAEGIESGGERAGMGRRAEPRDLKNS